MTGRVLSPAAADRKFFERFAHRNHRIRVAAQAETITARRRGLITIDPPAGFRAFVGVRSDGFGRFHYAIGHLRDDCDTDMDEGDACDCFDLLLKQDGTQPAASPADQREVPRA